MRPRRIFAFTGALALVVILALPAVGQTMTGGCTATVNGRSPESMTKADPLLIDPDVPVTVSGSVPPAALALPAGQVDSTLDVYVHTFGLPVKVETRTETGHAWGGTIEVPSWLGSLAAGLYKIEGDATGTPGWSCNATGYVKLGDGGLTAVAAVGAVGLAAGVALSATSPKPARSPGVGGPAAPPPADPKDRVAPKDPRPAGGKQPGSGTDLDKSAALQANLALLLFLLLMFLAALVGLGT